MNNYTSLSSLINKLQAYEVIKYFKSQIGEGDKRE